MIKSKNNKLVTLILLSLVVLSALACNTPNVHAANLSNVEKGLIMLDRVAGIDLAKYTVTNSNFPQDKYLGLVPQDNLHFKLQSSTGQLEIIETFTNGNLRILSVIQNKGNQFILAQSTSTANMAKDFLSNYQAYSGNQFYGQLSSTLDKVDTTKNSTTTKGDFRLDATSTLNLTTFRWTYVYNGMQAPAKCVAIAYKDGFLAYFVDNWAIYKIGSTSINLSEQDAISGGLIDAQKYSWTLGTDNSTYQFKDFKVNQAMMWETIFSNGISADTARGNDPLTLYPMRHVWVSLDKFYPGNVYGIEVFYWADSKTLYRMQERSSTFDPPVNSQLEVNAGINDTSSVLLTVSPILAGVALFVSSSLFIKRKAHFNPKVLTFGCLLICTLIIASIFFVPVVEATVNRNAIVWGSRSSGAYDARLGCSWRKTGTEVQLQSDTAADIASVFSYYGDYSGAHNYQGPNSLKPEITGNISYTQNNYPFTAVVDFDHGVGNIRNGYFHYMFEDDRGCRVGPYDNWQYANDNGVYDYEVFAETGGYSYQSNVHFAYISTCLSANITYQYQQYDGSPVGMPYAWTHRIVESRSTPGFSTQYHMSNLGYVDPDSGDYVYIGFPYGSAALAQTSIQNGYPNTAYAYWIDGFFREALIWGLSVHDALYMESLDIFQRDFSETDLYTGFDAIWPMYQWNATSQRYEWQNTEGPNSTLAIYGNSGIYLRAPELTVNAYDSNNNAISANVYIDGQYRGITGNCFRVTLNQVHTVQVTSSYSFYCFDGYSEFQNPITVTPFLDTTVTARYYTNPPPQYDLYVSSGYGGSTSLSGDNWYSPGMVSVTAYPDYGNGYGFDYWLIDGSVISYDNPINIPMSASHTLQANFAQTSVWVGGGAYDQVGNNLGANIYVDSNWAGYGSGSLLVPIGWHYIDADSWVWDDYWGTYVFPVSGIGWWYATSDTYITIYYAY